MAVKDVDQYIEKFPKWEEQLTQLRQMLLSTGLEETIKWGAPTYMINGKNVVGMSGFKNHYGLWFFQGALLKENTALLVNAQEDKTKAMRQMRFEETDELNPEIIRKYVLEAIQNQREGKEIKADRTEKTLDMPAELTAALDKDQNLKESFEKLTPGKQREYANHISEAKREETRKARLEKIEPMIKDGRGLYDKYKNC